MPVHLDSITNNSGSDLLAFLLQNFTERIDGALASEDKRYLHLTQYMRDAASGSRIGKFVFTYRLETEQKVMNVLDVDITLDGGKVTELRFLELLPGSSDTNEYYDVAAPDEGQHLQIETVNRHCVAAQNLVGTQQRVRVCAFPFRLSVYDSIDSLNEAFGLKRRPLKGTDMTVGGLSGKFAAPGNAMPGIGFDGEIFSLIVGTVQSVRDVTVSFGERAVDFAVVTLDSALGPLPTAIGRDVFALDSLAPGKAVFMLADVKADFAIEQ